MAFFIYFSLMRLNELSVEIKSRFFTLGELGPSTSQVWFVLHGYGQLAKYFIRKFDVLKENNVFVVAPEGLSRFYLEPVQGTARANDRVGASWMTKEDRQADIDNYLSYLNKVYTSLQLNPDIPITILGFSQGAATASRWVCDGKVAFERLVLWSGVFPPDMNIEAGKDLLKGKTIAFVYGQADQFLDDNRFSSMQQISAKLDINPDVIRFDGGHELDDTTLLRFV